MRKYDEKEVSRVYAKAGEAKCKLIAGIELTEEEKQCIEESGRIHKEFKEVSGCFSPKSQKRK